MTDIPGLPTAVVTWIEDVAQGKLTFAERRPGGGRREAWVIDVLTETGIDELFLRYDTADPALTGDPFTLEREARIYAALQDSEVPVPPLLGSHPSEQAMLCRRMSGETWFSRLRDEDQREAIASEFMGLVAALHRVDVSSVDLQDEPHGSVRECVEADIARWEGLYRYGNAIEDPLLEFGFSWLKRNIPDTDVTPVLVQGDTGPGNFLYQDGRVTTVLDWELAHFGDPMEDLGWLALRAVQEPFTNFADRLADYARISGRQVDLDRLRYYRAFAEFKVVVLGSRPHDDVNLLGEVGNGLIYRALHRKLFADALLEHYGVDAPVEPALSGERTEREYVYDAMLAQLREIIVPRSTDSFVVLRAKGMARMAKYLREADRYAPCADELERAALEYTLGTPVTSIAAGRGALVEAIRSERVSDAAMLEYVVLRTRREMALMRPAMGVLADRTFDPLVRE